MDELYDGLTEDEKKFLPGAMYVVGAIILAVIIIIAGILF